MEYPIQFTCEALGELSENQQHQLYQLYKINGSVTRICVSKDFSLPSDYVAVEIHYRNANTIYGGMDAEGNLST